MSTTTAAVRRYRAPSGNPDADYFYAACHTCDDWKGAMYPNRTIEGRRLAARDAADHNAARHSIQGR